MRYFLITSFTFLIITSVGVKESSWELKKDSDGIAVYTKTESTSGLKVFRGVTEVKGSLSSLISLMKSVDDSPNWIYNCTEATLLKSDSFWEEYIYFRTEVRWPFRDRDAIVHLKLSQDPDTHIVTITMKGVPDYLPKTDKVVRMPIMDGYWQLAPVDGGRVIITYQMMSDPGKGIPDFLAKTNLINYPFETLLKLKSRSQMVEYQNAVLAEIVEPED